MTRLRDSRMSLAVLLGCLSLGSRGTYHVPVLRAYRVTLITNHAFAHDLRANVLTRPPGRLIATYDI